MDSLEAYLDREKNEALNNMVRAAIAEIAVRHAETAAKQIKDAENEYEKEMEKMNKVHQDTVDKANDTNNKLKSEITALNQRIMDDKSALDNLKRAVEVQRNFFAPVVGYELLCELIQREFKCESYQVRDKIYHMKQQPWQRLKTVSITHAQVRILDQRFRKPRNAVCHIAWIWAWMHGNQEWVEKICCDQKLFSTPGVVLTPQQKKEIKVFLNTNHKLFACRHCETWNKEKNRGEMGLEVKLVFRPTPFGAKGLYCPGCLEAERCGLVAQKLME